jgi:hypothetical protein
MDIYVPVYALALSECISQGVYLTRRQPRLRRTGPGRWETCTVSGTDVQRLAELIYCSLDEDRERGNRMLVLVTRRLIVLPTAE